jgi:hypothetical protein
MEGAIGNAPGARLAVRLSVRSDLRAFMLAAFRAEPALGRMYLVTFTRRPFFFTVSVLAILEKNFVRPASRGSEMST